MFSWALKKLFGTSHDRAVRRMRPRVAAINDLEPTIQPLSDAELREKTIEFKQRLDNGASLDDILIEAFAVCREAGKRALRMRHFDVQLMGGMVLHKGAIAEMKTGEGKTLVATLPLYLNALQGKGAHLVTVNDYLARRDAEWMGKLYNFLGLSVGVVVAQQNDSEKKHAYKCDITYGQNNEFGFDYLRDNMKFSALDYAQRPLNYAIVDEVDSILIDEARTPLIISGQGEKSSDKYRIINEALPRLRLDEHYVVDEKNHSATLTDDGVEQAQRLLSIANLYDPENLESLHILNQCLRAHTLYKRDVNYMVSPEGKVLIIDEFTGRVLPGRRWSDGLHQAVEAKENVNIQEENRTLATITFQNLFRIYNKLAGMTGTADTEAAEFHSTYKLDVVAIPTNKTLVRTDNEDIVYKTEREKFTAVIEEIIDSHERGQPVLVGTTSVEKSAAIARILKKKNVPHSVLNAKHHEREAYVVAQAGKKGAITVSTNMAGRGTDIILGGNPEMIAKLQFIEAGRVPEAEPTDFANLVTKLDAECKAEHDEVVDLGGLYILGTERHESRRIDNQLRGRSGRQGDPGTTRFFLSLEDDLMRIFAGDRVKELMDRLGMPDDEPIEHPWVTKSIENAQTKVETRNFDIRKNLLEYDDVMNAQRKTVYGIRQSLLVGRYAPEQLDELGKPTGKPRHIAPLQSIADSVIPVVNQLLGLYLEEPTQLGPNERHKLVDAKLAEQDQFRREVYEMWGMVFDPKKFKDAAELYDEIIESVPQGLTEQRERALDLMDRIISAMVEESCPANRPPEDWDWPGIRQGFEEHFCRPIDDVAKPIPSSAAAAASQDDIPEAFRMDGTSSDDRQSGVDSDGSDSSADSKSKGKSKGKDKGKSKSDTGFNPADLLGEEHTAPIEDFTDQEMLAREMYRRAELAFEERERELGSELLLRVFRHVYLEEIDRAWVDHLTNMDHLRDGIGLRGYGHRDPKQEYKREGYNMFVNMMAAVSANVVTKLFRARVQRQGQRVETEADAAARQARQLLEAASRASYDQAVSEPPPPSEPPKPKPKRIGPNDPCPCGSGKKFKKCHGSFADSADAAESD